MYTGLILLTDTFKEDSIDRLQMRTRDSIKMLNNLTYNITSPHLLRKIKDSIDNLVKEIPTGETPGSAKFVPLRKRLSRKKFAKRSGSKASLIKKHSKLKIEKGVYSKFFVITEVS